MSEAAAGGRDQALVSEPRVRKTKKSMSSLREHVPEYYAVSRKNLTPANIIPVSRLLEVQHPVDLEALPERCPK